MLLRCIRYSIASAYKRKITRWNHRTVFRKCCQNRRRSIDDFRVYSKLLNWRTKGDYSDLYDFSKEDIDMVMLPARHFIDQVKELIDLP